LLFTAASFPIRYRHFLAQPRLGRHLCSIASKKYFQAPSGAAYSACPPDDAAPTELVIFSNEKLQICRAAGAFDVCGSIVPDPLQTLKPVN
jgi:hypothetical protein